MIAVDTGVLALALNRWAPEHARASHRLEALAHGDEPWAMAWPAVHRLLSHVTDRHAVARALSPADASAFVDALLASPSLQMLGPTPRHAQVLREVLESFGTRSLPRGFETATILREHGVRELLSRDPAMKRFGFLVVLDSFAEPAAEGAPRRYRRLSLSRRSARR
jgi:predicted nucleic acid-binding protein